MCRLLDRYFANQKTVSANSPLLATYWGDSYRDESIALDTREVEDIDRMGYAAPESDDDDGVDMIEENSLGVSTITDWTEGSAAVTPGLPR